jgi:hypothetical protein
MRRTWLLTFVLFFGRVATAETLDKTGTFAGINVEYKVILPDEYAPSRAYPAVLVFGGGPQTSESVNRTVERSWREEAERRG